jgi:HD-GYP domain-containing protein (c-di-GMP phosphodiesterase class II)
VYTKYISRQPDMVLLDKNLLPREIAEILMVSLRKAMDDFYDQMVNSRLDELKKIMNILVEYVIQDPKRMEAFICTAHKQNTMGNKPVNVAFVALSLYVRYYGGRLNVHILEKVGLGFLLHDIGMTRIPKFVTEKDRMLNPEERRRVKEHPSEAVEVMRNLDLMDESYLLPAMQHHERMDGGGYPNRLRGDQISILGRITAVADSYVAMITERPFTKEKKPLLAAVELLKDQTSYDIRITSLLVKSLQEVTC